ncbi:MAG: hypothetical protein JNM42_05900 [Propionivibrio sp.]|uniref:hypothetical protein n=1 Tax=Propionivibrio sp. TaxID=2212460 RepID=UPI001A445044|nr:hypothetical protein [Propionivibrio sp.]MBL8413951.1 hypothetical protein [Propionivibrio sp.]
MYCERSWLKGMQRKADGARQRLILLGDKHLAQHTLMCFKLSAMPYQEEGIQLATSIGA